MDESRKLGSVTVQIFCGGVQTQAVWHRGHWWCAGCGKQTNAVKLPWADR